MGTLYYYAEAGNQPEGPVSLEELLDLRRKLVIKDTTYVIEAGTEDWKPFSSLLPSSIPPPLATPTFDVAESLAKLDKDRQFDLLLGIITLDRFLDDILKVRPDLAAQNRDYIGTHIACYAGSLLALFCYGPLILKVLHDDGARDRLSRQLNSALKFCERGGRFKLLSDYPQILARYIHEVRSFAEKPSDDPRQDFGVWFATIVLGQDPTSDGNDPEKTALEFLDMFQTGNFTELTISGGFIYTVMGKTFQAIMKRESQRT